VIRRALVLAAAASAASAASALVVPGGGVSVAVAVDGAPTVVAGPGASRGVGYATAAVPVRPGERPLFVNTDVSWHNLVADEVGADDRPWCNPMDPSKPEDPVRNRRQYPIGACPLFRAEFVAGPNGVSVVEGLDAVVSGKVYEFRCEVVEGMTGNFFVL